MNELLMTFKVATGIGNLQWVQDQIVTHDVSKKQGLLVSSATDPAATCIKIKHKLFKVSVFFCVQTLL